MVDLKEIKSIEIVPFTLMTSSVNAVWAFIYAIFLAIVYTIGYAVVPTPTSGASVSFYVASIVASPVLTFVLGILQYFLIALIYNPLVPKLGGIKLGLVDMREIKSIPVVPFALITSVVWAVITLIFLLIVMPYFAAYMSVLSQTLSSIHLNTTTIPAGSLSALGTFGTIGSIIFIIIGPIFVFVAMFVLSAITTFFYNVLAPRLGGINLEFAATSERMYEILSIAPVQAALILASVATIWGIIIGLILLVSFAMGGSATLGLGILVGIILASFVVSFIVYGIMAWIYNFLRPRIGGIKLELE